MDTLPIDTTRTLVAFDPRALQASQATLGDWTRAKLAELDAETDDLQQQLHVAAETRFQTEPWRRQLAKARARRIFYEKVLAAVEAGYLVIPNLPMRAFAVRRREGALPPEERSTVWRGRVTIPARLPAGEGEYVGGEPDISSELVSTGKKDSMGKEIWEKEWFSIGYAGTVFPVVAVHAEVLRATERALALRLFDAVGLVAPSETARPVGDPIVIGRIVDPRTKPWSPKGLTFFIAWWFDRRAL